MAKVKGCAFLCNENGIIQQVLRDDFGITKTNCTGKLFTTIIDEDSVDKSLNLILESKNNNIAFDYRLDVHFGNKPRSIYFLGVHLGNQLLLIGADNHHEAVEFTDHLQQINNEQTNLIRSLLKEKNQKLVYQDKETEALFDELTRVNNELVNLQRELNRKNSELERLNEIKNHFLGMAAHDLRNPLSNINALSDFLEKKNENLNEKQVRFINHIKQLSSFMLNLVNELLDVSVIESGNVRLNSVPTDLISLLKTNIGLNKSLAEKKQIEIYFESDIKSLILKIDHNKIDQVVTNFITNAIKYSNPKTQIYIKLDKKEDEVKISVVDQGQGIAEDEVKSLFKPFQKTSTRSTAGEKSTGLGLYIVKRIIIAHNGQVGVESKLGKGSTFYFTLPLNE